jgi:hypothetical protein
MKYVHKYLNTFKAKDVKTLDPAVFKDIHFMAKKYIELIGSVELNKYMMDTTAKLGLDSNSRFQSLITDIMINTTDISSQGRVRSLPLERFLFLTLHLNDPNFYLKFPEMKEMYLRELTEVLGTKDIVNISNLVEDP